MVSTGSAGAVFVTGSGDTVPVTFTTALLVVRDVWFKPAEDGEDENDSLGTGHDDDAVAWNLSAQHDSLGHDDDDGDDDDGAPIRFRGPFVVNLLTQSAESLDTQMVPPGVYRSTKGHVWPLRADDWNAPLYDYLIGTSVYLQGTVDGEGGGEFTYEATIRHLFKIRGEFTVEEDTPATAFIVFDISTWLRGRGGAFLDPREPENDKLIQHAIIKSLKVGMDRNRNGRCDDRTYGEDD
jgi:hypothetical protein